MIDFLPRGGAAGLGWAFGRVGGLSPGGRGIPLGTLCGRTRDRKVSETALFFLVVKNTFLSPSRKRVSSVERSAVICSLFCLRGFTVAGIIRTCSCICPDTAVLLPGLGGEAEIKLCSA